MKQALEGIRIIEIGDQLTQYAGKLLADMGAEVIKVEPPEGVNARRVGPFMKDRPDPDASLYFWHYNTSKKSLVVNMEKPDELSALAALCRCADVILEGNPPGKLENYHLDYTSLHTYHPRLIYCSVTPVGQNGPWKNYSGSDLVHLALGGVMSVTGYDDIDDAPPIAPTGGQSYHLAGYFAASAIVAALVHREMQDAPGQFIDISVHESVAVSTEMSLPFWEYQQAHVHRQTGRHALPSSSCRWNLKCRDDRYILCLNTYLSPKRWEQLVAWLAAHNLEQDLCDPRYFDDLFRAKNMQHVVDVLAAFCLQFDADEIYHYAQSIGLPWAPVRAPEEMLNDPHIAGDRKAFVEVPHSELGITVTYPGAPYKFSKTPWAINQRPPVLGEHNSLLTK